MRFRYIKHKEFNQAGCHINFVLVTLISPVNIVYRSSNYIILFLYFQKTYDKYNEQCITKYICLIILKSHINVSFACLSWFVHTK